MSDYLFSSKPNSCVELTSSIRAIYKSYTIVCHEFTGNWGSISVSPSPYKGFQPFETETHICVVLGGPVFYFRDNSFLSGEDVYAGTRALLERFIAGSLNLIEDVSGPFQLIIVDKTLNTVTCITDLMLFIPSYISRQERELVFGSHVDAVARVTRNGYEYDEVSLADFVLHGVVTYPYTVFDKVKQMHPATTYCYQLQGSEVLHEDVRGPYWLPCENNSFGSLREASKALREGIQTYVDTVTMSMESVGQFISGGEDSRVLLGLLPGGIKKDGYIFLDSFNREGKIAQKVATAHGAELTIGLRDPFHYLDIAEEACALVGSGHQYVHCHSLKFDKEFNLKKYPAVFGGYLADSLLKGLYARKYLLFNKYKTFPELWLKGNAPEASVSSDIFDEKLLEEISHRRLDHAERVQAIRPRTSHEWFGLWPATMRKAIPNHYCNRRLFASYEIFMSHEAVKLGSAVPTEWKLNRRLFNRAFKSSLRKTKWVRHSSGRLPYFGWFVNGFIEIGTKAVRKVNVNKERRQGPWPEYSNIVYSDIFEPIKTKINLIAKSIFTDNFDINRVWPHHHVLSLLFLLQVSRLDATSSLEGNLKERKSAQCNN